MRLAWSTDVHLNFIRYPKAFGDVLALEANPDAVVITGDIAEADSLAESLEALRVGLGTTPLYFVLGNHDFYRGSIAVVKGEMASDRGWLTVIPPVILAPGVILTGHDGVCDAQFGDPFESRLVMNDFDLIHELRGLQRTARVFLLREWGKQAAVEASKKLQDALSLGPRRVVFATHYPPFKEACWHNGGLSNGTWLPYFTCKAIGDVLVRVADENPDVQFQVLCGHTHSKGIFQAMPNLVVHTGKAEYGAPDINAVFEF